MGVSSFGNPRIEAYLQLPVAYRSLSRPSSAPDAKAFTLCSCSLELLSLFSHFLELLEFLNIWFRSKKAFLPFLPCFPPLGEIVRLNNVSRSNIFTLDWKDLISFQRFVFVLSICFFYSSSLYSIFNDHKTQLR